MTFLKLELLNGELTWKSLKSLFSTYLVQFDLFMRPFWPFLELFGKILPNFVLIQAVKIEPNLGRNDQSWAKNVLESEELS